MRAWLAVAWLVLSLPLVAGCDPKRTVWQAGIPGVGTDFEVSEVHARGRVLDARLTGPTELETFVRANDACRAVFRPGQSIAYHEQPPGGRFSADDVECPAVGIGSLRTWRDRASHGISEGGPVPRAQASFEVVYRDEDVVFLRGRFPLAVRIGWTGADDTVAVVAADAACAKAVDDGVASMEFRAQGPRALSLISGDGLCPITGLVLAQVWR